MKDVIRWCSYWRTYSRILTYCCKEYGGMQVEVDLTGVRGWDEVAQIHIRAHGTARGAGDLGMTVLPLEVRAEMEKNLGVEKVNRLLTEDFLAVIDWEKYDRHNNGGACLGDIRKD